MRHEVKRYKYIDDAGVVYSKKISDFLAEVGGLEEIQLGSSERVHLMGSNHKPRHFKLVAVEERPGMAKYRADVITNERDPSKVLNKIFVVRGIEMRCIRYVGEQRPG